MTKCRCGARGDDGEMVEHVVSKLDAPDDGRAHGWDGEPEQVTAVRVAVAARSENRRKIAAAAGLTVEEYLAAR